MTPWYKVVFSVTETGHTQAASLQLAFETLFKFRGQPKDAVLFADLMRSSDVRRFIFSPGAVRIAGILLVSHGAVECKSPRKQDVVLCVGRRDAIIHLP